MAWIEAHQELANHPKTLKLSLLLKIPKAQVIGMLLLLWWWSVDYAPDGNLSKFDIDIISGVLDYKSKDPRKAIDALITAGFLNEDMTIHDWSDYTGRLILSRQDNKEREKLRKQRQRDRHRTNDNVTPLSRGTDAGQIPPSHPCHSPTVHNSTQQYTTVPTSPLPPGTGGGGTGADATDVEGLKAVSDWYTKSTGKMLSSALIADTQRFLSAGADAELIQYALGISLSKGNPASYFRGVMQNKIAGGIKTYQQLMDAENAGKIPATVKAEVTGNPFLQMLKEEGAI